MLLNLVILSVEVGNQYLNFKTSYTKFSVKVCIVECGTNNNDHFDGCFIKIKFVPLHPWPLSESSLKPTCTPKHIHVSLDHSLVFSVVLDPLFCLWILKFGLLLFLFCCALESSCMGRLSTIKIQLALELKSSYRK